MNLGHLNDKQREAVLYTEGALLILAGAGSGKTATMTHRIAHLLEEGVSPYNILAVTFTNKAAKEMRERIENLVGDMPNMWILTFHAMSLRILREYYETVGYKANFVVYDTVDQKTLLKNIIKSLNIDTKLFPQNYLASIISKEKERDVSPDEFLVREGDFGKAKTIYSVYSEYQKQLIKNNAMDFDDLLRYTLHILQQNPQAREKYQRRFKYIMVDEYQDTNHIQYEIVKIMAMGSRNLCVVGDDDQCIYQWRGADISNILNFEKDFQGTKVIKLEQNYRSYGNILSAAHSVIKNNKGRREKKLWTEKEEGNKIVYRRADTDKEEAQFVAQEISLLKSGAGYDDFAVLYRTNAQSRLLEDALRRRSIPYKILSGFSFYERKETKDMISYMRMVLNPSDDLAFKRIVNEPKRGVGPTTMAKLEALGSVGNQSLFEILLRDEIRFSLNKKPREAVTELLDMLMGLRQEAMNMSISDIYDVLLAKSGYMKALEVENTVEAESRIENLLDFRSFIADFEEEKKRNNEDATLEEFLEKVSTDSDADKYDENAGAVTLMTIHSAKGLEFPVVFLVGMEEGLFPSQRSLDSETGMEEERRLCYVGITRAKERLFLTSAAYRMMYGHGDFTIESTFLREIDPRVFDPAGDGVYNPRKNPRNNLGINTGSIDGYNKDAVKPYDPLKYAKTQVVEAAKDRGEDFQVGDQVTHSKFGFGIVIESGAKTITVNFEEGGPKKLAKGIAPLKKV